FFWKSARHGLADRLPPQSHAPTIQVRCLEVLTLAKILNRQPALLLARHNLPPSTLAASLPNDLTHDLLQWCEPGAHCPRPRARLQDVAGLPLAFHQQLATDVCPPYEISSSLESLCYPRR